MQNLEKITKNEMTAKHKIILDDRQNLVMTGVTKVDNINTECINCRVNNSVVCITGKDLHIAKLDVDTGNVEVVGEINSIKYLEQKQGFLKRIFK